jgi:hypothetical protein
MSSVKSQTEAARSAGALELVRALPAAALPYLRGALDNPVLVEEHVVLIARSRAADAALLQRIGADPAWARSYQVKAALVRNPKSPKALAMNLARFLFWRDLAAVADDPYLAPPLRRLAERILSDRIPEMAVGERIALARMAGRGLVGRLLEEADPMVLEALLWNGRVTEQDLVVKAGDAETPPEVLDLIGRHPRWSARYNVRTALARNPRTPLAVSLGFLTSMTERDLAALADLPAAPVVLRLACRRILADEGWRRRRAAEEA